MALIPVCSVASVLLHTGLEGSMVDQEHLLTLDAVGRSGETR